MWVQDVSRKWWPRGRWNGRRIIGVEVLWKVVVADWSYYLWPRLDGRFNLMSIHWLGLHVWVDWIYADPDAGR